MACRPANDQYSGQTSKQLEQHPEPRKARRRLTVEPAKGGEPETLETDVVLVSTGGREWVGG